VCGRILGSEETWWKKIRQGALRLRLSRYLNHTKTPYHRLHSIGKFTRSGDPRFTKSKKMGEFAQNIR
jgi:hypothetical protein